MKATAETRCPASWCSRAASRAASAKAKASDPAVCVQSVLGGEISVDEIVSRVKEKVGGKHEKFDIYIKTEDNKAYYATEEESGYVELW